MNEQTGKNENAGQPEADILKPGEYSPAGERQGVDMKFSAADIAAAFDVDIDRVHKALAGEFDLPAEAQVDSRQVQQLSEVLLGDQPLDQREAALMTLGAFTPRPDHATGIGDADPDEKSDSIRDDQPGN